MGNFESRPTGTEDNETKGVANTMDQKEFSQETPYDKALNKADNLVKAYFKSFPKDNTADHRLPFQEDKMIVETAEEKYEIASFKSDGGWYTEIRFTNDQNVKYKIRIQFTTWSLKKTISVSENDKVIDTHIQWSSGWYHQWIERIAFKHIAILEKDLNKKLK